MEVWPILTKFIRRISFLESLLIRLILLFLLFLIGFMQYDQIQMNHQADKFGETEEDPYYAMLKLMGEYPDVIGWIDVENTGISYPIVQGEDNETYVSSALDGSYSQSGSIFLDSQNSPQFTDMNHILYGHNMIAGKMFGDVKLFEEYSYYQSHQKAVLYLQDRTISLELVGYLKISAYDESVYDVPYSSNEAVEAFYSRIESLLIHGNFSSSLSGPFVSLSTCTVTDEQTRHLLIYQMSTE